MRKLEKSLKQCVTCQTIFRRGGNRPVARYHCSRKCYGLDWSGKHHTEETKLKMSRAQCGHPLRVKNKEEWKLKIRKTMIGRKLPPTHLANIRKSSQCIRHDWNVGRKASKEWRLAISNGLKGRRNPAWRGGVTSLNHLIRNSARYDDWRKSVFERDNYTCQICVQRGGKLEADHLKPFSKYPELRFEVSNGRTLCKSCHRRTNTWGYKSPKTLEVGVIPVEISEVALGGCSHDQG